MNTFDLFDWLRERGFTPDRDIPTWFDLGTARVEVDDTEIVVYRFTPDRARLLEWKARFSSATPASIVRETIKAAVTVAASDTPTFKSGTLGQVTIPEDHR